jgi:hypothetical protein
MALSETNNNGSIPVEKYLNHLDAIFQTEPVFYKEESTIEDLPGVIIIVYKDIPEPGYITGITYGLSLVNHPDWKFGRPELSITMASSSLDWPAAMGYLANNLRGEFNFSYGQAIEFGQISDESEMDAFFIFAPAIIKKEDYLNIDIGLDYKINIAGLYPIYSAELEIYHQIGLEKFWHHPDFDIYSATRNRITTP